jgi:hypothetical protein
LVNLGIFPQYLEVKDESMLVSSVVDIFGERTSGVERGRRVRKRRGKDGSIEVKFLVVVSS